MSILDQPSSSSLSGGGMTRRQAWGVVGLLAAAIVAWLVFAV